VIGLIEAPVASDLKPFVQAFVERSDSGSLGTAIELPETCPLFQFVLGEDYLMRRHGTEDLFVPAPRTALWGPTGGVWQARVDGPVHVYCVVLTHLGAAVLGCARLGALIEQRIDVRDLGLPDIGDDLRAAPTIAARTALVTNWLRAAFAQRAVRHESDLALAGAIAQGRLIGSVDALASELGISARGLHKKLVAASGWAPKYLLRLARLQTVLRQIHPRPWGEPVEDDALLQFHDESHLARDFKQLTGMTPTAYRAAKRVNRDCLINTLYVA
jgi:AraC-like DNA-binding protein